jgi:hypothetical protein
MIAFRSLTHGRLLESDVLKLKRLKDIVFAVTACFFPGLRGRQKDCSTDLILRTPMCTRPRRGPKKCEWKHGVSVEHQASSAFQNFGDVLADDYVYV